VSPGGLETMSESVFFELQFYFLIVSSIVVPIGIYAFLSQTRAISRTKVLILATVLIVLSGVDIFLLKSLELAAKVSLSKLDDQIFSSELSIGFYLLPAVFAGIAVNLISHILIHHLNSAERQFDREHAAPQQQVDD
jgi:uncharacterized metal-binding protein